MTPISNGSTSCGLGYMPGMGTIRRPAPPQPDGGEDSSGAGLRVIGSGASAAPRRYVARVTSLRIGRDYAGQRVDRFLRKAGELPDLRSCEQRVLRDQLKHPLLVAVGRYRDGPCVLERGRRAVGRGVRRPLAQRRSRLRRRCLWGFLKSGG